MVSWMIALVMPSLMVISLITMIYRESSKYMYIIVITLYVEIELITNTLLILLGCIMMHRIYQHNHNINSPAAPPRCRGHFEPQNRRQQLLPRICLRHPLLRQPVGCELIIDRHERLFLNELHFKTQT